MKAGRVVAGVSVLWIACAQAFDPVVQSDRQIPRVRDADVVVVGGSSAAVAAALAAKTNGASVFLVAPRTSLGEDVAGTRGEQLAKMVASNVQRLKRLVDDVTEVAPGVQPDTQALDASAIVQQACEDWAQVNGIAAGVASRFVVRIAAPGLVALFDAEQLRRVLVNLLDNALRHADPGPGSIAVSLARSGAAVELVVASAGAPVPPDVERHLFEPFFSTRSRGSGLGLYICRELCERHGARIEYRRAAAACANEFCVHLRASNTATA